MPGSWLTGYPHGMPFSGHHCACAGSARGAFALPGTQRQYERSLPYRFLNLELDLSVDITRKRVAGHATLEVQRQAAHREVLELDAVAFDIEATLADTGDGFSAVGHTYDGETLCIEVPDVPTTKPFLVRVVYAAKPKRGLYFLAPDKKVKLDKQVWSQCQDEDARHWFPCHDKPHVKTPLQTRFRVPREFDVLSNGELVADKADARFRSVSFTMSEPVPSYLVTLVVGQFDKLSDRPAQLASGKSVPVEYWVPKGRAADGWRAFSDTPRMIELFSKLTGVEYPYGRYTQAVVQEFIFGGMENTTATTMYEHILLDERAAIDTESHDLVAHELAHQWFGDWVTCQDWPHAWLNEGFATFFELVEREDRLGQDEYFLALERDLAAYVSEVSQRYSRPVVSREYSDPIELFDRHLYQKGGLILHLLREELGADVFWRGVNGYLKTHEGGHATTQALKQALSEVSGRSLDRFFDEWLERAIHPVVKARVAYEHGCIVVRFHQTQATTMQLTYEAEVRDAQGTLHQLRTTSADAHVSLSLALPARPSYVGLDPRCKLIGQTTFEVPFDLLEAQLRLASTPRLRRQACALLAKRQDHRAASRLGEALHNPKETWLVRHAAAAALGRQRNEEALEQLLKATRVKEPRVRAAVASALGCFRTDAAAKALTKMLSKERSYQVEAAVTRALGGTRQSSATAAIKRQLAKPSWADIVSAAACEALASLGDDSAIPTLLEQTQYGVPTRARRSAILALGRFDARRDILRCLELLLDDPHPHVRSDVVTALERLADPKATALLRNARSRESDARVRRRLGEALRNLDRSDSQTALKDKLSQVERQLEELQGRVSVAEAKLRTTPKPAPSTKRQK